LSKFLKNRSINNNKRKDKYKKTLSPITEFEKKQRSSKKNLSNAEVCSLYDEKKGDELLKSLNEEQSQAATSTSINNLIVAGAGTGKTSTIVARVVYLLKNGTLPSDILLITFTSKAANEMKERIVKYIQEDIANDILIGTFHSTAINLLKSNGIALNLQSEKSLKAIFTSSYYRYLSQRDTPEDFYAANTLFELYGVYQAKRNSRSFHEWFKDTYPSKENQFELLDAYDTVFDLHEEATDNEGIVGFNELLMLAKDKASEFKQDFKEVIIDEYQDTSFLQIEYINSLSHEQLFCVGDYDQSIYAFNGADISIIGSFTQDYKNTSVINLYKNYRSSGPILALAQKSILLNERLFEKKLQVMRTGIEVEPVLASYLNADEQYIDIANKIKDSNVKFSEIAVLYRNNASANGIELTLKSLDIDTVRDDNSSFFDIDEVRYTINLLKLLRGSDRLPLIEILNSFSLHSSSHQIVNSLLAGYKTTKDAVMYPKGNYKFSVSSAMEFNQKHSMCKEIKNSSVGNLFFEIYQMFTSYSRLSHEKFIDELFNSPIIQKAMEKFAKDKSFNKDKGFNEFKYKENLENILSWQETLRKTISAFKNIDIFLRSVGGPKKSDDEVDGVRLLSVHGSKGLEFPHVYLIDMNDSTFPNEKLMSNGGGGLEEERRLFYVSNTRAKDFYHISWGEFDFKKKPAIPSRFLFEIGLIEEPESFKKAKAKKEKASKAKKKEADTAS